MKQKILNILKQHNSVPIMFVGAGLSRRYLGLENWEGLLKAMANKNIKSEYAFDMYVQKARSKGFEIGLFQKIAELIGKDMLEKWYTEDEFEDIRKEYHSDIIEGTQPIKIEIANYIKENSKKTVESYISEVQLLKEVSKKSIAGVLTTNYDLLLENIMENYKVFVGQEELIFSQLQGVGEIYKIHGCCTKPNSIIINEEDYINFNEKQQYLAAKILTMFLEHPIIFVGYSIGDENIKNILKDIVKCLSEENLLKLKNRFIFVEWDESGTEEEISTYSINFDEKKSIDMTKIRIHDYKELFNAMLENKSKYSAPILRQLKQDIYELVLTNEPGVKMKVVGLEDDDNLEKIECVLGVGVLSEFGNKGYMGLTAEEIFLDVIFDDRKFDANLVVAQSLPVLLAHNSNSIPIYKYISKCECQIPEKVIKEIKSNFDELLSRTITTKRKAMSELKDMSITDIVEKYGDEKALEFIAMMPENKIEVDKLNDFLIEFYYDHEDIFKNGNSTTKTNYRRLIKIFDWLKYSKQKES
ncbi:MAG: SIR2 family protein [Clostridiaceae bacterium]